MEYQETSRLAWREFLPHTAKLDRLIMGCLEESGRWGRTCSEVETILQRKHESVSGNLRHLVRRGLVFKSGRFGKSDIGNKANLWVIARFHEGDPNQTEMF